MSPILTNSTNGPERSKTSESQIALNNFQASAHAISPKDRKLLHELTVGVFWPHRASDLDLFISLGEGYLAIDEIGRPMGSAMCFPAGKDFALIGMMVTSPRLQTQGAGRWLLNQIIEDCAGRDLRLSATRAGYWLYERAGFVPVNTVWQHQGIGRNIHLPAPVAGVDVRPLCNADIPAILALDRPAFGADRSTILTALLKLSEGCVAVQNGDVIGYALIRPFGRGKVIGPVIAEQDQVAMQMIAPFVQANVGTFLRLDTPERSELYGAFLAAAGMGVNDTVTEMRIGPHRRASDGPQLFGMASHSLG